MKTTIKIMIAFSLVFSLYFWFSSYAEWEKVIIDPVSKKIIIQSWDQNLDLDALKAASQSATWDTAESVKKEEKNESTVNEEKKQEEPEEKQQEVVEEKNSSLYAELEWGEEIDKALYWMYTNGLTKYDNLVDYRPDDPLLREEAAKIIGQAYIILWYSKDVKNTSCSFSDEAQFDPSLASYVKDTCSYWIFRWSNWSFLPQRSLSKAEALTVLIRILEGELSSEEFSPWWTLYFVKAKNIALSNESDVNSLDRPVTRREIALLVYRFKKIVLDAQLNNAAKQQLSLINQNPVNFVPENKSSETQSGENTSAVTWNQQSEETDFSWVLSWVDFWVTTSLSILSSPEVVEAINWMKDKGLTTAKDINAYKPFEYLTREQAAKMFLQFAKALGYTSPLEENVSCEFNDLKEADPNLVPSIQEVCRLWLMQWGNWKFSPNVVMSKSQFVAMLVRLYEWKRLDETTNPWWANYFIKAGELWILDKWDISSFEWSLTRYEAALLFYRFQLKQAISMWLNTWSLKNEVLSSVKNSDGGFSSWDLDNSYAVLVDGNLLKNQFFQEGYLELLWERFLLKKTAMTVFDIWDESFVWYGDLYDFASDVKVWTVNFIVSNGNIIQWTIRLQNKSQTWNVKESKNTTAWYNLVQL